MARANGIRDDFGIVRDVSGAPAAADSATLTDANIPASLGVNCRGLDSVFVSVELTGGASPTATVEALFRDPEAPDGQRWKRKLLGAPEGVTPAALAAQTTGALDGTAAVELRVHGHPSVAFRITGVANNPTNVKVIVAPGKTRQRPYVSG